MEKPLIYIGLNGAVVYLPSYPLYTLQAEPFGLPPITLLAECPDKMLNSPKMLKRKGKAEGCEANALPLPQGLK